ncbi:tRNA glutamyl-Q(34) synthetase GluQRS [Pseudoflavonifractor phocaeensis]|uniref:tRNA glutamyl-Q(34) synthetase GluQRS n=1 Tax=Pseudoflavonifractor phocaeensis TaxID=1870988 RepID=UPI00313CF968
MEPTTVKGRFAPSPSGRMHLGNLFSALLAWLSVRSAGGRLVLRVEDLDPVRCQPAHAWQLMEDLEWLGLDWDEGGDVPSYWQSSRGARYAAAFARLEEQGLVYPCFCTRLQRLNEAPHVHDVSPACPCAALTPEEVARRAQERPPSWRVRVPRKSVSFTDGCQGPYTQDLARECGDFPVRRWDGAWAYQLAVVVDDAEMGITQVVRGRDLLSSTPRQLWLYEALGLKAPSFYHVPLLLAPGGRRLAKRDADLDMGALRRRYTPQQLLGLLAHLAGQQADPSPVAAAQLAEDFSWEKVPRQDITVDPGLLA